MTPHQHDNTERRGRWQSQGLADGPAMYALTITAKLNDVDPRAWLADVLARIADHPASRLHELLPRNWKRNQAKDAAAA